MKTRFSLVVLAMAVAMVSFLDSASASDYKLKGAIGLDYYDKYIGGLTGTAVYDHSVGQGSLKLSLDPLGLYAKVCGSYSPKGGFDSDFGDEVDYIIGLSRNISNVSVDIGYAFYDMINIGETKGDLHAIYLILGFPKIFQITPHLKVEQDIAVDKEILEGGFLYKAGFGYSHTLLGQPIDFDLSFGGHDGAYGKRPEIVSFGRIGISTTFVWKKMGITPQINFQEGLGYDVGEGGMAKDEVWGGISLSYLFDLM